MTPAEIQIIAAGCERFLDGRRPANPRQMLQAVVDSPLSLERGDVYGKGGVVALVESEVAQLLGKEAAVFMPSGTMAQQIALRVWSDQGKTRRIAFHPTCHLEIHEQMGYKELHGLEGILVGDADRLFTVEDLAAIPDPISTLLIELPQREIGGQLPTWEDLAATCDAARARGMRLHMDGARLWECQPYYGRSYAEICDSFDSVYVSFYKTLGGLPGAILAGPESLIEPSRTWQRRHGGNLHRQAANAISAKISMDLRLPRIGDYVKKAAEIAQVLNGLDGIRVVPERPQTNMMHLHFFAKPERVLHAALQIAAEDRVGLFFWVDEQGKTELSIGDGALDFENTELADLFRKLTALTYRD